jgi:hypothetical protein
MSIKYTRLFAGPDGESHFEDCFIPVKDVEGFFQWSDLMKASAVRFAELYTDKMLEWHHAPGRLFLITLAGEMIIGIGDGTERIFKPGDLLLAEDTTGRGHTRRRGKNANHLVAFVFLSGGAGGAPLKTNTVNDGPGVKMSRLYTGTDNESHYEDVYIPMKNFEDPTIPLDQQQGNFAWSEPADATGIIFAELYNDKQHDWQKVPRRQIVITLGGRVEWACFNESKREFGTGDILLAEDTTGRGHKRKLIGTGHHKVAMITLDEGKKAE